MINKLTVKMMEYYSDDPCRIQHFIKVHSFCKLIGELENLPQKELYTLEIAALVHDIGIKQAEILYEKSNGKLQEILGPSIAQNMLKILNVDSETSDRVCFLVGHHHTYDNIDGLDYQILIEADFLVNMFEDNMKKETIQKVLNDIFKTKSGIYLCKTMFGI